MNIYESAAQYLLDAGWTKGAMGGQGRPSCLLGAIQEVSDYQSLYDHARIPRTVAMELYPERTNVRLPEDFASERGNLVKFNDHPDTTLADILIILKESSNRSKA
jgi:hypothetical protein